jgi:hypothetical protein
MSADTATQRAADWLEGFLADHGGRAEHAEIQAAAQQTGISRWALRKARLALGVEWTSYGPGRFQRRTRWSAPCDCSPFGTEHAPTCPAATPRQDRRADL